MTRNHRAARVLIVDDDRMSREVLSLLLASDGYSVECVASGEAAVGLLCAAGASPKVILADVQMPGLSGSALAYALRKVCTPGTVLLAMSASDALPAILSDFDGFLVKPFRPQDLSDAVVACDARSAVALKSDASCTSNTGAAASKSTMSTQPHGLQGNGVALSGARQESAALDERIYCQLNESMNKLQLQQMYGMCLDDVRSRISDMRGLAECANSEQFIRQAHAIKGGCGMLGASELYAMAASLEKSGLSGVGPENEPHVNRLDELWAACDRLERILATRT